MYRPAAILALLAVVGLALPVAASADTSAPISIQDGISMSRTLAAPLLGGRVMVETRGLTIPDAETVIAAVGERLADFWNSAPWPVPFSSDSPLRLVLTIDSGLPRSVVSNGQWNGGALAGAIIEMNIAGRSVPEVTEEAVRDAALLVLHSMAPQADPSAAGAAARALALPSTWLASDGEEIQEMGAAPSSCLSNPRSEIFAALWIDELAREAGGDFIYDVWSGRAPQGGAALADFATQFEARTGMSASAALEKVLARAYSRVDVFPDFARLTSDDLAAGSLDASLPGPLSWRFYSTFPGSTGGENVSWPADGASGFAVFHYDGSLPDDVVEFHAGDNLTLPLSGVARVDFVVTGDERSASPLAAPAVFTPVEGFPVTGLTASATTTPDEGVRLNWTTASHKDLLGWVIFRKEAGGAGQIIAAPSQWLPAQENDPSSSAYIYVDPATTSGHYYQYDVWAVTASGALSHSFRATLRAR